MSLVDLATESDIAPVDRDAVESGRAQYGTLLETWRAILRKPGLFSVYLPFLRGVAGPGVVDDDVKGLSALYVGYLNNCRYTVSHRLAAAAKSGVAETQARAVVAKEWDGLPERLRVALEYTEALTLLPPVTPYATEPQCVAAELLDRVRDVFSDEEIVELTMSISVWNALARFHRVMGFELDMPAPPDDIAPR